MKNSGNRFYGFRFDTDDNCVGDDIISIYCDTDKGNVVNVSIDQITKQVIEYRINPINIH